MEFNQKQKCFKEYLKELIFDNFKQPLQSTKPSKPLEHRQNSYDVNYNLSQNGNNELFFEVNLEDINYKTVKRKRPEVLIVNIDQTVESNFPTLLKVTRKLALRNYISLISIMDTEVVNLNKDLGRKILKNIIFLSDKVTEKIRVPLINLITFQENRNLNFLMNEDQIKNRKRYISSQLHEALYYVNKSYLWKIKKNITKNVLITKNLAINTYYKTKKIIRKRKITIFHVTHWKAGSQWIFQVFKDCFPNDVRQLSEDSYLDKNIFVPGFIYTPLYLTPDQFNNFTLPKNYMILVIVRDLRDTLISLYFSMKYSHIVNHPHVLEIRRKLYELNDIDSELLYLTENGLLSCANIQRTWLNTNVQIFKYEDLLKQDVLVLTPLLQEFLNIPKGMIRKAILKNRFEKITQGRKQGEELKNSHQRKAQPGDWKNYFNENLKSKFKSLYGDLLIQLGYEKDGSW